MNEKATETKNEYRLSLKGPGITVERTVDAQVAAAIAQAALGGVSAHFGGALPKKGVSLETESGRQPLSDPGRQLSLREFLQLVASRGGIHAKILAVGRYMRDYENQADFSREDIRNRFRSAGEPQPANFPRDFQKAVRAAWVAEDHQNRGRFYVTSTGDVAIEQQFEGSVPTSIRPRRRRVRLRGTDGA